MKKVMNYVQKTEFIAIIIANSEFKILPYPISGSHVEAGLVIWR